MKKIFALLLVLMIYALPAMAADDTSDLLLDDRELEASENTDQYTFVFTEGASIYGEGELTLKNNASLGVLKVGGVSLTINVPAGVTASIGQIMTATVNGETYNPQAITIEGGGTLNVNGGITAGNGLSINGGTTVNVNDANASAVFVQKGTFGVYGGSTLHAVGNSDSDGTIVLMDVAFTRISNGSTVKASGSKHGLRNYCWNTGSSHAPGTITVSGNSVLELTSNGGAPLYNRYWNERNKGILKIEDTSTVRMSGPIEDLQDTNTEFPVSYRWRTTSGGSWQQHPYSYLADQSGYTYLEVQGNSAYVPQVLPSSAEKWIGESQTFTVSSANGMTASGVSYQWYLNGTAVPGENGESYTCTPTKGGAHTVRCDVTVSGLGTASLSARLIIKSDISDLAKISNPAYYWRDDFTPTVTYNGSTLEPGTDYTVTYTTTIMDKPYQNPLNAGDMLTMTPGTHTLTYTFKGAYSGSKTADITVSKVPFQRVNAKLVPDSFEYNGQNQYPTSYTAEYKGYWLKQWSFGEEHYDIGIFLSAAQSAFSQTINPGTYYDTIEAAEKSLYFTGSKKLAYTIKPGTPVVDAPTGLSAYYGQKLSDVALPAADHGTWTWKTPDTPVGDVGEQTHKAVFTPGNTTLYHAVEKDVTVTVVMADTAFEVLDVYNGSEKTNNFIYGDVITVKAKPVPVKPAGYSVLRFATPQANQMALFLGDTQISEAADADENGVYEMTVPTGDQALPIGESRLTAKYVSGGNMADHQQDVTVTLNKRTLSISSISARNRAYEPGNAQVEITEVVLSGVYDTDSVRVKDGGLYATLSSEEPGTYTAAVMPEDISLEGDDSAYYKIQGGMSVTVSPAVVIDKAVPVCEVPAGLQAYYSQKLSDVALPAAENGTWTWKTPDTPVGDVGEQVHKAVFTPRDTNRYYAVETDVTVTVVMADTDFEALDVYNGSEKTNNFTYGDVITVKAKPVPVKPAGYSVLRFAAPQTNQMALFIGDTQISEAVDADENGVYTMQADTADKALAIGENTITVKYTGTVNMADYSEDVKVTLKRKPLTVVSVTAQDRYYKPGEMSVVITGGELITLEADADGADDVRLAPGQMGMLDSDQVGEYAQLILSDPVPLEGTDAGWYTAEGAAAATSVRILEIPAGLEIHVVINEHYTDEDVKETDLGSIPALDTVAEIERALRTLVKQKGALPGSAVLYDVVLEYLDADGVTWVRATREHFPDGGIRVILPVVPGTAPDTHTYVVAHMFTMNMRGNKAGEVEYPAVTVRQNENGEWVLDFVVTGLSPVMVAAIPHPDLAAHLPKTGDSSCAMFWAALCLLGSAGALTLKGRKKRTA